MSNDERAAPRRQVLDSSLFPQITDTIIDFAPTRCLQALCVNKGFRDLVDSHLAYHLAIHKLRAQDGCPLNRYEVLSDRGVVAQIDFTPETIRLVTASYFRSARILDISIAARWPSMMPALVQACPDAAFRFNERTDLRHLDFCNATVVIWGEEKPTTSSGFLAYGIDEVNGIDTLVIHLRAPGRRDDMFDLSVKHLVLILHPWEISETFAAWFAERLHAFNNSCSPTGTSTSPRRSFATSAVCSGTSSGRDSSTASPLP